MPNFPFVTDVGFTANGQAVSTGAPSLLASWTTAGRPASPANGQLGFNTTLGYIEWYSSAQSNWYPIFRQPPYTVTYLVIAGGAAGGGQIV